MLDHRAHAERGLGLARAVFDDHPHGARQVRFLERLDRVRAGRRHHGVRAFGRPEFALEFERKARPLAIALRPRLERPREPRLAALDKELHRRERFHAGRLRAFQDVVHARELVDVAQELLPQLVEAAIRSHAGHALGPAVRSRHLRIPLQQQAGLTGRIAEPLHRGALRDHPRRRGRARDDHFHERVEPVQLIVFLDQVVVNARADDASADRFVAPDRERPERIAHAVVVRQRSRQRFGFGFDHDRLAVAGKARDEPVRMFGSRPHPPLVFGNAFTFAGPGPL